MLKSCNILNYNPILPEIALIVLFNIYNDQEILTITLPVIFMIIIEHCYRHKWYIAEVNTLLSAQILLLVGCKDNDSSHPQSRLQRIRLYRMLRTWLFCVTHMQIVGSLYNSTGFCNFIYWSYFRFFIGFETTVLYCIL